MKELKHRERVLLAAVIIAAVVWAGLLLIREKERGSRDHVSPGGGLVDKP